MSDKNTVEKIKETKKMMNLKAKEYIENLKQTMYKKPVQETEENEKKD